MYLKKYYFNVIITFIISHKCMCLFNLIGKKNVQCENIVQRLKATLESCLYHFAGVYVVSDLELDQ